MASDILPQCGRGGAAAQQRLSPASTTLPLSITKTETIHCDVYSGPAADLVAAGLVRADQFPPPGRASIAYLDGKEVRGRCKMDETYFRVEQRGDWAQVRIGLRVEIAKDRRAADGAKRKTHHTVQAAEAKSKEAAAAVEALQVIIQGVREQMESVPKTGGE